jgi:Domain of unknown function (DUF6916)
MLDSFTLTTFAGREGQSFAVHPGPPESLEWVLVSVADLGGNHAATSNAPTKRRPFSLIFRGPRDPILPQQTYPIAHPELGRFDLFVVPVGRDRAGTRYEAVFT